MRDPILFNGFQWAPLELIYLDGTIYEGCIGSRFTFVQKGVLVIT